MEYVYWALTIICMILSGALMLIECKSRNWLAAFMAFFAGYLGLILLDAQAFYISPKLYFLMLPLLFIPGPLLLGYIGHISTRTYVGFKDFLMCFLPSLIVLTSPDLVTPLGLFELAQVEDYQTASYLSLFNFISAMAGIHILTYVTLSFWLILRLRQDWILYQSKTLPKSWYKMVQVVAAILVVALLQVLSAFLNPSGDGVSIGDVSFILFVLFFIHQAIHTLWGSLKGDDLEENDIIIQPSLENYSSADQSSSSGQNPVENFLKKQGDLISEKISQDQLFLQHDLSLTSLAGLMGLSTHKLSETINTVFGQTFYEYINDFRVNYAAQKLITDTHLSIADVFHDAGFTTKSTFYSHFKKKFNCTPSQYKKAN